MRPEPRSLQIAQPYHRPCPRLSFATLVSASGRLALSRCQTLQILVFNKIPVSTFCMPLCKATHHSSYRSPWTWGSMGLKMLYVNIHLV